jgi:hypothetical protein
MVTQARERGLVSPGLHILDATHLQAKVNRFRLKREHCRGEDDDTWADRHSPDPDARFGRKGKGKTFYASKAHTSKMPRPSSSWR